MLNVVGTKYTRGYQELAMQSRLKIPLLFSLDVIHGYKTVFPIPLAESASWNLDIIRQAAEVAAEETLIEEEEMEKNTNLNAGALKNPNCMDVDLEFGANTRIEEFMAMVSTQRKQKKNQTKTATREKKRRNLTLFHYSEKKQEEHKNVDMLNINKNKEEDREIKKSLTMKLQKSLVLLRAFQWLK